MSCLGLARWFEARLRGGALWGQDAPTTWPGATLCLPTDQVAGTSCPHERTVPSIHSPQAKCSTLPSLQGVTASRRHERSSIHRPAAITSPPTERNEDSLPTPPRGTPPGFSFWIHRGWCFTPPALKTALHSPGQRPVPSQPRSLRVLGECEMRRPWKCDPPLKTDHGSPGQRPVPSQPRSLRALASEAWVEHQEPASPEGARQFPKLPLDIAPLSIHGGIRHGRAHRSFA